MLSKNHPIILFIDRFGFSAYQDILTNIPKFSFTPDLVSNLDVINKEQLASLIATFIQINKIVGSSLAVILSDNVIYVRDLANPVQKPTPVQSLKVDSNDDKDHEDEIQNFLENIPFEEVLAKVIKTGNVNRIVAVNKDLVMAIIDTFINKGSTIEAITPSFMYGQNANFTAGLTENNIRVILENAETLKSGNLLTDQERIIPPQNLESELKNPPAGVKSDLTNGAKKPQNLRQYILVGIFVTFLVILTVVYLNLGVSQTPPVKKVKNSVSAVSAPAVIPTLAQTTITTTPLDIKDVKIRIINNIQSDTIVNTLKNQLIQMGFENIAIEISEETAAEKSSILFSQNVSVDARNIVVTEIKKMFPDVSVLENQDSDATITILMGKS